MVEPVLPLAAVGAILNLASKAMQRAKERDVEKQQLLTDVTAFLNEMTTLQAELSRNNSNVQPGDVERVRAAIERYALIGTFQM